MKHIYLLIACCFYIVIYLLLFSRFQYNINADGIAYIQQARQYSAGNFQVALNGCWSPLIAWILVPFIKAGCNPLLTLKYLNGFWGLVTIISFYFLSARLDIEDYFRKYFILFLPLLLLSYVFYTLGPDLLQLFLLSLYLHILFSKNFINSITKLIGISFFGAICYFAKAYSFYFFIVHISLVLFFVVKKETVHNYFKKYLHRLGVVLVAFFLFTSPYIFLISKKYEKFTISTASAITLNKSLEPSFTDGKKLVVAPKDKMALSIADDPSFFQEKYISMFSSPYYFIKQVKLTIANFFTYFKLLNDISFLAISIVLIFVFIKLLKPIKEISTANFIVGFTFLFYPLGYLLIAIEWRYIWLLPILLLLMCGVIVKSLLLETKINPFIKAICVVFIFISFSLKPILILLHHNEIPNEYYLSKKLKDRGIRGSFFSNLDGWENSSKSYKIAYWNNMKVFGFYNSEYSYIDLVNESKKFGVQYFFYFYNSPEEKEKVLRSDFSKAAIEIISDIDEVIVYKLQ